MVFHINSTNSDQITNWRKRGKKASKTASFMYISYCDTITTQILYWIENAESTNIKRCCMMNSNKKLHVYVWSGWQPRQVKAVRVFGRVWNQTKQFFRSKPGLQAGYPEPLLTLFCPECYRRFSRYASRVCRWSRKAGRCWTIDCIVLWSSRKHSQCTWEWQPMC